MIKRTKSIVAILVIFLFLTLFYKWQLAASSHYLNRGDNNYNAENYNQALKDYKYVVAVDGNRNIVYRAKVKRAEIFYASGMFNEARRELFEAIEKNKTGFEAYELLGDVNYTERKFDLAIDCYNQVLQFNNGKETETRIKIKKGKSFIAQDKTDLAGDIFSELYRNLPQSSAEELRRGENENGGADNGKILYYLALLDFDKNVSFNDFFKKIENSDEEVLKNKIEKIKSFVSGYEKNENSDYNNVKIADLYNKINEPYLALNKINIVFENNRNYRDAWIISGEANFIIADYKKSLEDFERAFSLDGNNPEICFWIGSVYEKMGDNLKSKEFFEKYKLLNLSRK